MTKTSHLYRCHSSLS